MIITRNKKMYKRYHIETAPSKLESTQIGKFKIIRNDNCVNCGQCADWCIYDVHKRDSKDPRTMAEPSSYFCKNCFSCVQNCPRQAIEMVKNEAYEHLGDSYWTPHKIFTIWNEAEEGMIPVYGAGYRGPFKGTGFDTIWTDMSEIVRPTRDGIHGREYIATAVDIGRKLPLITDFNSPAFPNCSEIQVPMFLESDPLGLKSKNIILSIVKAANKIGTLAILNIENYSDDLKPYLKSLALRFPLEKLSFLERAPWKELGFLEITLPNKFSDTELASALHTVKTQNASAVISLGITTSHTFPKILRHFRDERADVLHFSADNQGRSLDSNTYISESIRALHLEFVKHRIRDEITIIGRGGIAAAEHVPKLIICGADAAVLDLSLLVAMGCRVCKVCELDSCPAEIENLDPEAATQRIINMTSSWRDQLLEILSAMGIKDVRRLRGEVGRAMFYEEIEKKSFEFIFNREGASK